MFIQSKHRLLWLKIHLLLKFREILLICLIVCLFFAYFVMPSNQTNCITNAPKHYKRIGLFGKQLCWRAKQTVRIQTFIRQNIKNRWFRVSRCIKCWWMSWTLLKFTIQVKDIFAINRIEFVYRQCCINTKMVHSMHLDDLDGCNSKLSTMRIFRWNKNYLRVKSSIELYRKDIWHLSKDFNSYEKPINSSLQISYRIFGNRIL